MREHLPSRYVPVSFGELEPFAIPFIEKCRTEFERLGFRYLGLFSLHGAVHPDEIHYSLTFTGNFSQIYASAAAVRRQRYVGGMAIPFVRLTGKRVTNVMLQTLLSSGSRLVTTTMSPPHGHRIPDGWMYSPASSNLGGLIEEHRRRIEKLTGQPDISVVPINSHDDYLLFPERYQANLPTG